MFYPKWIDEYVKAEYQLTSSHDATSHAPFNLFNFYPLYADLWVDKFYQAIKKLQAKNLAQNKILELLPMHSSIKFNFLVFIYLFPFVKARDEVVRTIVDFFLGAIQARATADTFAYEYNKTHSQAEIDKLLQKHSLAKVDQSQAKELGKITMATASLAHTLYNDFCTDYAYDIFGPYDVSAVYGRGHSLLIRSFSDIRPQELWPELKDFPYHNINIYAVYKELECKMYYIGCHLVSSQNLVEHLTRASLIVDGKEISGIIEWQEVRNTISETAAQMYAVVSKYDFERQKKMVLRQQGYQFKKLFQAVGVDWQPSKEMLVRVAGKALTNDIKTYQLSLPDYEEKFGINYLKEIYRK